MVASAQKRKELIRANETNIFANRPTFGGYQALEEDLKVTANGRLKLRDDDHLEGYRLESPHTELPHPRHVEFHVHFKGPGQNESPTVAHFKIAAQAMQVGPDVHRGRVPEHLLTNFYKRIASRAQLATQISARTRLPSLAVRHGADHSAPLCRP